MDPGRRKARMDTPSLTYIESAMCNKDSHYAKWIMIDLHTLLSSLSFTLAMRSKIRFCPGQLCEWNFGSPVQAHLRFGRIPTLCFFVRDPWYPRYLLYLFSFFFPPFFYLVLSSSPCRFFIFLYLVLSHQFPLF